MRACRLGGVLVAAMLAFAAAPAEARTIWLCKPGMANDRCAVGLQTTHFAPNGDFRGFERVRRGRREIDCFYVYPTVSDQKRDVATRRIDPEIDSIARYQAARYSQECRVFAPVYRQLTIQGIQEAISGGGGGPRSRGVGSAAYADVLEAWRTYLRRYNRGRGVVLIGHSQGTFVLRQLIAREIDDEPDVRRRLVSALLLGGNVEVRRGRDVGGDFDRIPACRSDDQTGCVVAFSIYDERPPANALFGRTVARGREVLCTNPAALGGGSGPIDTIYPSAPYAPGTSIAFGIALLNAEQPSSSTPWVSIPRAYTARCARSGGVSYLHVRPRGASPDLNPSPTAEWGLHLTDGNLPLGNLVEVVRRQAAAYAERE